MWIFPRRPSGTLQVLDYAVLVISGTDGVQSHTETLWRLLRRYRIPTFVFVNKMDLPGPGREALLTQLNRRLGDGFVDFGAEQADRDEALALCDERLMETDTGPGKPDRYRPHPRHCPAACVSLLVWLSPEAAGCGCAGGGP